MIQRYLMMMIQFAGIHNGFHNKNYLDNIDIADIDNNMGNTEAAGEHTEVVGEHMKAVGEHTEVVGKHTEAVGEHTEMVGKYTEYTEVAGNRQIAEVQQHW
jgi:hypothetical protein